MKLISWNVNGLRAIVKKDFILNLKELNADIVCIQETKAQYEQVNEALIGIEGYNILSSSAERKGYSGTAMLCKEKPLSVTYGIGIDEHDKEGRTITAEYTDYYIINVYVPNSGSELIRLNYRKQWDIDFYNYLKRLEKSKPLIVCGDFNVAHKPIDIARPKDNYNKSAGYTQKEIDGMDRYTQNGLIDSFRYLYPNKKEAYSWWSYRFNAKAKNIGWRIDYFLISQNLVPQLNEAFILSEMNGSDHCPIGIIL